MILDQLSNAALYENISKRIKQAFQYLQDTDLVAIAPGKYAIDGDKLFVIVQEYGTLMLPMNKWKRTKSILMCSI